MVIVNNDKYGIKWNIVSLISFSSLFYLELELSSKSGFISLFYLELELSSKSGFNGIFSIPFLIYEISLSSSKFFTIPFNF